MLHQLLDDVPMATLINGYGSTTELGDDYDLPGQSCNQLTESVPRLDLDDGVMLGALDQTGISQITLVPSPISTTRITTHT